MSLRQRVEDGEEEVGNHQQHKLLEDPASKRKKANIARHHCTEGALRIS